MKKWLGLLILVAAIIALAFFWQKSRPQNISANKTQVTLGDTTILADVSDTPALREQGLSGRKNLGEGEGMLFVFPEAAEYGFWMKDMNFPIDIVWVSADKRVVGVEKSVAPETYPKTFKPTSPVLYVLELPAGFSLRHNIDTGTRVYFEL